MAKKYSINMENDELVSVEVDGITYTDPGDIPDPEDRAKILELISKSTEDDFDAEFEKEFENFDQEFRELEKQSAKFPVLIVGIFLLVALITLSIAVISGISASRAVAREVSAPGQVVDLITIVSQADVGAQGGNYNMGMISGINFTGDRNTAGGVTSFPNQPLVHGPGPGPGVYLPAVPPPWFI